MIKPIRIFGWFLQFAGAALVIFAMIYYSNLDNILGRFSVLGGNTPRTFLALCMIGVILFAIGRQVYLPEVKLLKTCPNCSKNIRMVDVVCPYCTMELPSSSRFPTDGNPR
ncbi:hypothetical protein ACFL6K_06445 [Candidatus Latescibacterota bacterium]